MLNTSCTEIRTIITYISKNDQRKKKEEEEDQKVRYGSPRSELGSDIRLGRISEMKIIS